MGNGRKQRSADDCGHLVEAVERGEATLKARGRGQYPGRRLGDGQLPGLWSIGYWDAIGPQTWGLPMHRNEGIEICCLLSGELAFATDHEQVQLRPGSITITRPWQRHRVGDPQIRPSRLFWIILDVEEEADGRAAWDFPPWIGPDADSRRELLRIFRRCQQCHLNESDPALMAAVLRFYDRFDHEGPLWQASFANLINEVFTTVAGLLSRDGPAQLVDPHGFNQTITSFFSGLEVSTEKAAEPWSVDSMARACRVGVTYLTASCRKAFNTTPSEQLYRIRLAHAARLLRDQPGRAITEIAFAVGFNNCQHFATRFRKQYGVAPRVYRKQGPP